MADPLIKPDPETQGASPGPFSEDDIYEDAGDLEFNTDPDFQRLYLARVPKFLWEAWSKLDDDAEIHIGTIRQVTVTDQNGEQSVCISSPGNNIKADSIYQTALQMLLSSQLAEHQMVPKEYELAITAQTVNNTFVFTEQDLPGFKSKSKQKFDPASANMPARLTRPKNDKPMSKQPYDPNKRFQPYYRKAIPSQCFGPNTP